MTDLINISTQDLDSNLNSNFSLLETSKADDDKVVHLTGAETITGDKTFSGTTTIGTSSGILKRVSGVLEDAVEGTDYLSPSGDGSALKNINSNSIITNSSGFCAYCRNSVTPNQWNQMKNFATYFNEGSGFNKDTGVFTCDAAGKYAVRVQIDAYANPHDALCGVAWSTNGHFNDQYQSYGRYMLQEIIVNLNIGDYLTFHAYATIPSVDFRATVYKVFN